VVVRPPFTRSLGVGELGSCFCFVQLFKLFIPLHLWQTSIPNLKVLT
jgi:hypothetical protein